MKRVHKKHDRALRLRVCGERRRSIWSSLICIGGSSGAMGNGLERKEADALRLSVFKNLDIFLLEIVNGFAASVSDRGPHLGHRGIDLGLVLAGLPGRVLG